jgi:hypothetical protein
MTVTIAGTSVAGTVSTAKSYVYWSGTSGNGQNASSDLSTGSATTTGNPLYLEIALKDAYGSSITSTSGALTVAATTGANVSIGANAAANTTSGTYGTAVSAANPSDLVAKVTEATAGAGWAGTVTVTYNGVVVATKSGTISGLASKIVATPQAVGLINATQDSSVAFTAYDASGNTVVIPVSGGLSLSSSSNTASVTNAVETVANTTSTSGLVSITGGTTAGTSSVVLKYTRTDGVVISSNAFNILVGNTAASYTASFDKTSYNQGDLATLKIKFLDSKGNAAASSSTLYTQSSTTPYPWNATLTVPMLTQVGVAGLSFVDAKENAYAFNNGGQDISLDANGVITIKFSVGTPTGLTAGNYNAVIDFPSVDAVAGSAQTVAYSVGNGGTSLNDVLKGIVSLIASINKQIAALAKLVAPAKKK